MIPLLKIIQHTYNGFKSVVYFILERLYVNLVKYPLENYVAPWYQKNLKHLIDRYLIPLYNKTLKPFVDNYLKPLYEEYLRPLFVNFKNHSGNIFMALFVTTHIFALLSMPLYVMIPEFLAFISLSLQYRYADILSDDATPTIITDNGTFTMTDLNGNNVRVPIKASFDKVLDAYSQYGQEHPEFEHYTKFKDARNNRQILFRLSDNPTQNAYCSGLWPPSTSITISRNLLNSFNNYIVLPSQENFIDQPNKLEATLRVKISEKYNPSEKFTLNYNNQNFEFDALIQLKLKCLEAIICHELAHAAHSDNFYTNFINIVFEKLRNLNFLVTSLYGSNISKLILSTLDYLACSQSHSVEYKADAKTKTIYKNQMDKLNAELALALSVMNIHLEKKCIERFMSTLISDLSSLYEKWQNWNIFENPEVDRSDFSLPQNEDVQNESKKLNPYVILCPESIDSKLAIIFSKAASSTHPPANLRIKELLEL